MKENERAGSELLGVVLLLGFVAITAGSILVLSGSMINSSSVDAQSDLDEQTMTQLSSDIHDARLQGETKGSVEFSQNSETDINTDNVRIDVSINGETEEYTLGSITHTVGDDQIIYEAGAVFQTSTDSEYATIQSNPAIEYQDSTLNLPLYDIDDESIATGNEISYLAERSNSRNERVNEISIEIHSDQYQAWERYLNNEFGEGNVSTTDGSPHNDGVVTVELGTDNETDPKDGSESVDSDLEYADAGGGGLTVNSGDIGDDVIGAGAVTIKQSTIEGDLDAWGPVTLDDGNIEGTIRGDGDVTADDGTIDGEVHARNGLIAFNEIRTGGEIRGDGDIDADDSNIGGPTHSLNGQVTFDGTDAEGDVYAKGDIDVNDGLIDGELNAQNGYADLDDADIEEGVYAMSSVSLDGGSIHGEIHAQNGDIDINDGNITESIYAQRDVSLTDGTLSGDIHAQNGDVMIDGTNKTGSIYTNNQVTYDNGTVNGNIHARGPVSLNGVTVTGDMYVSGDISCDDSTVEGEIYVRAHNSVEDCDAPVNSFDSVDRPESPESQSGQVGQKAPDSPEQMPSQEARAPTFGSNDNEVIPTDQNMVGTDSKKNKGGKNKGSGGSDTVTIPAGQYELDQFRVNEGETVIFDTSDGPIDIKYSAARGNEEIEISEGGEVIVDDGGTGNEVNFYSEPASQVPLKVDEGSLTTRPEAERGDLLNFYSTTQQRFYLTGNGHETFNGEIIAPDTNHEFELTDLTLVGGIHIPNGDVTIDVDDGYAIKPPGHESSESDDSSSGESGEGEDSGKPGEDYYLVNISEYTLSSDE